LSKPKLTESRRAEEEEEEEEEEEALCNEAHLLQKIKVFALHISW